MKEGTGKICRGLLLHGKYRMNAHRDLLEQAAVAAALTVDPNTKSGDRWTVRNKQGDLFNWAPRLDDGDAS